MGLSQGLVVTKAWLCTQQLMLGKGNCADHDRDWPQPQPPQDHAVGLTPLNLLLATFFYVAKVQRIMLGTPSEKEQ